ncbi:lysine--tRNA ligase [Bryobacter aggregatus]|uniref:lysine--tRNA ligase n=1 Tax=Bryobacter aggregatus TaxID=360054 RepID=UPI0006899BBE|nr:lysine--tRNA ligase [Bryobacter aggregatus]
MSNLPLAAIRNVRLQKIASLRELGLNPFPSKSHRSHMAAAITSDYDAKEGQQVTVAGRLMSWRKMGGMAFGNVQDQSGQIQIALRRGEMQGTDAANGTLGFENFNLLDVGDVVECTGKVGKTKTGEISVIADSLRILTKSLRPFPDKHFGIKDREIILRKRYLDTTVNPENRTHFEQIALMLFEIRRFLNLKGFLEFNTPIIQPQYGGGTAKPFLTRVNALSTDMYLAISHELYLKRLITAGFDKVFIIGRHFRNEGIDRSHHPEFVMLETMTAYENYEYNMRLIEEMFRHIAVNVFQRTTFQVKGHEVDFAHDWPRIRMTDAVRDATGIDFTAITDVEVANAKLAEIGIHDPQPSVGNALVRAFEEKVEKTLIQPTFIYGHPIEISPLAKPMQEDPRYVERFEIFIAGMECGDNWTEQNDPVQLLSTWKKAFKPEDRDEGEFHPLDYDFVETLEHAMPPTTGIGPGLERMAMIFTGQEDIYDVIFFPMMKPLLGEVNKVIFEVKDEDAAQEKIDLLLGAEEFEALLKQGKLKPRGGAVALTPVETTWEGLKLKHDEVTGLSNGGKVTVRGADIAGLLEQYFPGTSVKRRPLVKS